MQSFSYNQMPKTGNQWQSFNDTHTESTIYTTDILNDSYTETDEIGRGLAQYLEINTQQKSITCGYSSW